MEKVHKNKILWADPVFKERMLLALKNRRKSSPFDRFIKKIRKTECCWIWEHSKYGSGYGVFYDWKKLTVAHRFSYTYFNGEIPEGNVVMHKCDNELCVNPEHLSVGTQSENINDMISKGRNRKIETYVGGEGSHNAKLTNEQVKQIRKIYIPGKSSSYKIADEFNVTSSTILNIIHGKTYKIKI